MLGGTSELCYLMVTAAKAAFDFPIPNKSLLVGEYDIQQITSPLCLHLDEKVPDALQEPLLCCPSSRYWAG